MIDMRCSILIFHFVIGVFACSGREDTEIKYLLNTVLEEQVEKQDSIIVSVNSYTDWYNDLDINKCDLQSFVDLVNSHGRFFSQEIDAKTLFKEVDFDGFCNEVEEKFKFEKQHVPENTVLLSQVEIKEHAEGIQRRAIQPDGSIDGKILDEGYVRYYRFSKPIFFNKYRNAIIYYSDQSFRGDGGSSLLIFQKESGQWNRLAVLYLKIKD